MSIKKFKNFSEVKEYGEGFETLPRGGYVLRILDAIVKENRIGQYIEIQADIAEGEYKGYFKRHYDDQRLTPKHWRGTYFLNVPNDNGTESDGWSKRSFKTFVTSLERSNPGYHFDWDETSFKGLLIGGLFNEREYLKEDGTIGSVINLARVCSVDSIRAGKYSIPADKVLKAKAVATQTAVDGFVEIAEGEAELPF